MEQARVVDARFEKRFALFPLQVPYGLIVDVFVSQVQSAHLPTLLLPGCLPTKDVQNIVVDDSRRADRIVLVWKIGKVAYGHLSWKVAAL